MSFYQEETIKHQGLVWIVVFVHCCHIPLALARSLDGSFFSLFLKCSYLCLMTCHHICPQLTLTSSQMHAFENNLLSVLIGVYMRTSIGLSTRIWKRYQKASAQRRIALISPQAINCQELLSKESHEDDLFHLC